MNVRLVSSVAAASGALLLAVAPAATAGAPAVTSPVDQVSPNYEVDFPVAVEGAEVSFYGTELTVDMEGSAALSVDPPTIGNPQGQATGSLSVSTEHPELGEVTLESNATGTASFNSVVNPFPMDLDLYATGTMTIENPAAEDPIVLNTRGPALLTGSLNQLPPTGEFTELAAPVELVDSNGDVVASVESFPVQVGSLG